MKIRLTAAFVVALIASAPTFADEYGKHPFYLHALSDLHSAVWQIDQTA